MEDQDILNQAVEWLNYAIPYAVGLVIIFILSLIRRVMPTRSADGLLGIIERAIMDRLGIVNRATQGEEHPKARDE